MRFHKSRTVVTAVSVMAAFVSIALVVFFRFSDRPNPLWNKLLLTYGVVFCLFLGMDRIGRQASRLRNDTDARRPRPRPIPSGSNAARAVVVPGAERVGSQASEVSLERARLDHVDQFQRMVDAAVEEVLALESKRPELDPSGHVNAERTRAWLTDGRVFPFFLKYRDRPVGCCVLCSTNTTYEIELFYVESAWRRRGVGTAAMRRLVEFVRMIGDYPSLQVSVSVQNARAERFALACGYQKVMDKVLKTALPESAATGLAQTPTTQCWLLQVDDK